MKRKKSMETQLSGLMLAVDLPDVTLPDGVLLKRSAADLARGIAELLQRHPTTNRVVVKLDEGLLKDNNNKTKKKDKKKERRKTTKNRNWP